MYKEKELKEEIARQVLIHFDEKKFDGLYLCDSPDVRFRTKDFEINLLVLNIMLKEKSE